MNLRAKFWSVFGQKATIMVVAVAIVHIAPAVGSEVTVILSGPDGTRIENGEVTAVESGFDGLRADRVGSAGEGEYVLELRRKPHEIIAEAPGFAPYVGCLEVATDEVTVRIGMEYGLQANPFYSLRGKILLPEKTTERLWAHLDPIFGSGASVMRFDGNVLVSDERAFSFPLARPGLYLLTILSESQGPDQGGYIEATHNVLHAEVIRIFENTELTIQLPSE